MVGDRRRARRRGRRARSPTSTGRPAARAGPPTRRAPGAYRAWAARAGSQSTALEGDPLVGARAPLRPRLRAPGAPGLRPRAALRAAHGPAPPRGPRRPPDLPAAPRRADRPDRRGRQARVRHRDRDGAPPARDPPGERARRPDRGARPRPRQLEPGAGPAPHHGRLAPHGGRPAAPGAPPRGPRGRAPPRTLRRRSPPERAPALWPARAQRPAGAGVLAGTAATSARPGAGRDGRRRRDCLGAARPAAGRGCGRSLRCTAIRALRRTRLRRSSTKTRRFATRGPWKGANRLQHSPSAAEDQDEQQTTGGRS